MAPISELIRRSEPSANSDVAYYLLIISTTLFAAGILSAIGICIFKRLRRTKKAKNLAAAQAQGNSTTHINEKTAFLADEAHSARYAAPEIRLTFPEEHVVQGNRQSRVVVVTIGDSGSVGYAPYHEPLPVYQQKESNRFHSLDLERIGGLKEEEIGRGY